uniref:Uncharacterized protein n=1 Tax=Panagrellus redivivus TaxID=6233 RepID=A0A7E4UR86_PANRE
MASDDLESAMSDLFEVMSIVAAGCPPHLQDRYAEILENNDKALVVLKKKKRSISATFRFRWIRLTLGRKNFTPSPTTMLPNCRSKR